MRQKSSKLNTPREKFINMLAAMIEISILIPFSYPLDTLKSRMQIKYYTGYKDCFTKATNLEHFKGLYRGSLFLCGCLMIRQPMKMVSFESASTPFYGGVFATVAGLVTGIPMSLLKTNLQTNNNFKINFKSIKQINLFNAWKYEIGKESIGNVTFFSLYGAARKYNGVFGEKHTDKMNFLNGTLSSMTATFLAYPVDTMKVRKQTIQREDTFMQIFRSVGYENQKFVLKNFWKGITPIFIRVSVFGGVGMSVYEKMRIILDRYI